MNARRPGLAFALVAATAAACARDTERRCVVFAAASLAAPFEELARAFEARHAGTKVDLHLAGTPQLVLQIREGAAVDVFAAADSVNMQKIVDAGGTAAPPVVFARNALAIVVGAGNPKHVASLRDLARPDLRTALCGPDVPAGRYAREALDEAGVALRSVSDEASVRALVAKVQLGEVDAGIVYVTDTRARGVEAVAIPAAHQVEASYPIAPLRHGRAAALGAEFTAFVLSAEGGAVLARHGFVTP